MQNISVRSVTAHPGWNKTEPLTLTMWPCWLWLTLLAITQFLCSKMSYLSTITWFQLISVIIFTSTKRLLLVSFFRRGLYRSAWHYRNKRQWLEWVTCDTNFLAAEYLYNFRLQTCSQYTDLSSVFQIGLQY